MARTVKSKKARPAAAEGEELAQGLFMQVGLIVRAIANSGVGKTLVFLIIGLFLVILATAYGQIRLNAWNKPFYDALSRRDLHDFLRQLGVFFVIAFGLLVLNVAQKWFGEMLKLKLRDGLLHDLNVSVTALDETLPIYRAALAALP